MKSIYVQFQETCERGFIPEVPAKELLSIQWAYNRMLMDIGSAIGWLDEANQILDSQRLLKELEKTLKLIEEVDKLLKIMAWEDLKPMVSPVLLMESSLDQSDLGKIVYANAFFSFSLLCMAKSHTIIEPILLSKTFSESIEHLKLITEAQSLLLVAQESVNKGWTYLYDAKLNTFEKISNAEVDASTQLTIEKHKKSAAGRMSGYDKIYNWAIPYAANRWQKEISDNIEITRIGAMAEEIKCEYIKLYPTERYGESIPKDKIKDKIRFIAKALVPQALKGGRPPIK